MAMATPFRNDGKLDLDSTEKLTQHLIGNEVDYLVVQGTTGEAATMTEYEKRTHLEHVLTINDGQKPVLLGFSGNNTQQMLEALESFPLDRVDGLLIASPYYNKPTQEGLYQHYTKLAQASPLPIMLYNVPGRTGSNILPSTVVRLAREQEKVFGIKEASANMDQVMDLIQKKPEDFMVVSGEDDLTLPLISVGGEGVISVTGNAYPYLFRRMVWASLTGKMDEARRDHYALLEVMKALFSEGNPGGIKELLSHMGICGNTLRLPLANVSEATSLRLKELMASESLLAE